MNLAGQWFSDFNQTLVFSVFLHLSFLVLLMYVPKPNPFYKSETIPLNVSLIPLPKPSLDQTYAKLKRIKEKTSSEKIESKISTSNEIGSKPVRDAFFSTIKQTTVNREEQTPNSMERNDTGQKILAQLNQLTNESKGEIIGSSGSLVQELDKLTKLKPKLEPKSNSDDKVWEKTFKEIKKIQKTKPVNNQKNFFAPPIREELDNSLEDFEDINKKLINQKRENKKVSSENTEILPEKKGRRDEKVNPQKPSLQSMNDNQRIQESEKVKNLELGNLEQLKTIKKLEFESFDKKSEEERNSKKTYKDLLRDLQSLANLNRAPELNSIKNPATKSATSIEDQFTETGSILESIERSIELEPAKNVAIEISSVISNNEEFPSKVKDFISTFEKTYEKSASNFSKDILSESQELNEQDGDEDAQAISLYAGAIKDKIYSNWDVPLGLAIRKKIVVSFMLFRVGTIDSPRMVQSSGNKKLDNLAMKAIFDSEPFPPFPKELRKPNIILTINFKLEIQ